MKKSNEMCSIGEFSLEEGLWVPGELKLDGDATHVKLFSKSQIDWQSKREICGRLHDLTKVTLLECVPMSGTADHFKGRDRFYVGNLFPHFVLVGNEHLVSTERRVTKIKFSVEDGATVFGTVRAFGSVSNADEHLNSLSKVEDGKYIGEVGPHPQLFYFNGKTKILSVETVLGAISAHYGLHLPSPNANGIRVEADVYLLIEFRDAKSFKEAIRALTEFLRFVELAAGRPQNVREVAVELDGDTSERSNWLDVHWSLGPRRSTDGELDASHRFDLPFNPLEEPAQFDKVLSTWLERRDDWRDARMRFATSFACQRLYGTDRLVGSANMFDLIPDTAFPPEGPLAATLSEARDAARELFRRLPDSADRSSVLGALGRIGKLSLKKKVRNRVLLVASRTGDLFPELAFVTDHAIDCRNYYVHGTRPKLDYSSGTDPVSFFTDTLEFVFAISDLVDAGWHAYGCLGRYTTMSHPFGRYRASYAENLAELKKLKAFD